MTDSRFEANYFGAYTFEAEGMRWLRNVFANNVVYGFDPHDFSNNFLVEENHAYGNGKHGIIFSRGCSGNIIQRNWSYDNRGHGIFLDDGKVLADGDPRHAFAVPSDYNRVEANEVWSNDVGIVLEGGNGNIVRANLIRQNRYGIRLKDQVRGTEIVNNQLVGNTTFGLYIYNHSTGNGILANTIEGATARLWSKRHRGIGSRGIRLRESAGAGLFWTVVPPIRWSGTTKWSVKARRRLI